MRLVRTKNRFKPPMFIIDRSKAVTRHMLKTILHFSLEYLEKVQKHACIVMFVCMCVALYFTPSLTSFTSRVLVGDVGPHFVGSGLRPGIDWL